MEGSLVCPHCDTRYEREHKFCPECGFAVEQLRGSFEDPLIGRTLPGGYVVMELIEVGGMGRIYRAEQKVLRRTVAVKIIHPHLLGDLTVEARFVTEARAASQLNHPNSVAIIDFGKFESGFYMVMEFLRGRDLATVAYEEGPLEIDRITDILCQILAALEEAHHLGIIHRDLKPENIVLESLRSGGDFVKVLDFGLAKVREAAERKDARRITDPGMVCGTPQYMAPEQARGDAMDHRADLYGCGVLLYELLTTKLPFDAPSPNQVVLMHLSQRPPDPRSVAPARNIPSYLADIVMKALAKEPEDRFQSATEFIKALKHPRVTTGVPLEDMAELSRCWSCGAAVISATQRFCGDCGSELDTEERPQPRMRSVPPSQKALPSPFMLPLTAREQEMTWLAERRKVATSRPHSVRIMGPPGIGKTRLLDELLAIGDKKGDVVTRIGPDPWRVQQGYFALRQAIVSLGELPLSGGGVTDWIGASPEARAGLTSLFAETDEPVIPHKHWSDTAPRELSDSNRRFLVAEALRWALTRAHSRCAEDSCLIFAIDDLDVIDGASQNAFADVIGEPPLASVLVVATHCSSYDPDWWGDEVLELKGLSPITAASLVETRERGRDSRSASVLRVSREPYVPPMYVEQLLYFGRDGGDVAPSGLADLVALRIEWLPPDARRVLQAIAVLGDEVRAVQLPSLLPDITDIKRQLEALSSSGFVSQQDSDLRITHPLIREVVLTSTPLEVRRRLHGSARRDFGVPDLHIPLEAHAVHAYHGAQPFDALMLLEQVADQALARQDLNGAVDALRMGLQLTRREMSRGELDDPLSAMLMFSCKLGDLLALAGQATDAEGVLQEALSQAGPSSSERPRILASLANVAHSCGQTETAQRYWSEALRLAVESDREVLINSLHVMKRAWQRVHPDESD